MLRGTQVLIGDEASEYLGLIAMLQQVVLEQDTNYLELVVPSIWDAKIFKDKIQGDTLDQLWTFQDKGNREICLVPEITAIVQEMYDIQWSKELPKPIRLFYTQRCFRYEKPQAGRFREFTQFGVEILGPTSEDLYEECLDLLLYCLDRYGVDYSLKENVKRGLGYYIEDGFEIECKQLGAQKQVAGGGRYKQGVGWAIGVERLLLAGRQ